MGGEGIVSEPTFSPMYISRSLGRGHHFYSTAALLIQRHSTNRPPYCLNSGGDTKKDKSEGPPDMH
jgi:hypothetical protein